MPRHADPIHGRATAAPSADTFCACPVSDDTGCTSSSTTTDPAIRSWAGPAQDAATACPARARPGRAHDAPMLPTLPAAVHSRSRGVPGCLPRMRRASSTHRLPGARVRLPTRRTRGPSTRAAPRSSGLDPGSQTGRITIMSDPHIRILRQVARHRQRDLDDHDDADHLGDPASTARRQDLAQTATRTRARVAAAQARRRYHKTDCGS